MTPPPQSGAVEARLNKQKSITLYKVAKTILPRDSFLSPNNLTLPRAVVEIDAHKS